jgi:hypothetical protein
MDHFKCHAEFRVESSSIILDPLVQCAGLGLADCVYCCPHPAQYCMVLNETVAVQPGGGNLRMTFQNASFPSLASTTGSPASNFQCMPVALVVLAQARPDGVCTLH